MRVPEFRAYDKDKKVMIHDFDQSISKYYGMKLGESIHLKVYTIGIAYGTLSVWTGMYDNLNEKIFEDDILADEDGNLYSVLLDSGGCFIAKSLTGDFWCYLYDLDFRVMGNIHQDGTLSYIGDK